MAMWNVVSVLGYILRSLNQNKHRSLACCLSKKNTNLYQTTSFMIYLTLSIGELWSIKWKYFLFSVRIYQRRLSGPECIQDHEVLLHLLRRPMTACTSRSHSAASCVAGNFGWTSWSSCTRKIQVEQMHTSATAGCSCQLGHQLQLCVQFE